MGNLQRRIERVEQECGIGKADEPTVEIPMGNRSLRMTEGQLAGLLRWLRERNGAPEGTVHKPSEADAGEEGGK